jgi:hypothetical protein
MAGEWREVTVGEFAPFAYGKRLPEHLRDPAGGIPVFGSNRVVDTHSEALTSGPAVIMVERAPVASAFGRIVQPFFAQAGHAHDESRTLAALRDALLPKLVRGEMRVKDAERFLKERGP